MNQKSLPPLNWLRTFEVSARSLNFTKAAHELHLTQGAVSQQIRLLEGHLGVALFTRLPRGLALTDEGMSYLPVVQDSISRLAAATNELFNQDQRTPVKIRGSLSFFVHWLAPKLTEFHRLYPNIDIRYISSLWVKDSEADDDFEIRWGNGQWPGYVSQRLSWDSLFPVCSPELIDRLPLATTSDLSEHTLLHVLGYEEGWGYWLSMVNDVEVDPSRGMQLDTLLASLRLAELGVGVALARSSMVEDMLADGRLVEPFDLRIPASESFYLVRKSGTELSAEATVFFDWLERQVRL
ncbi:MAG: LysR substrate-binding domain-containing protein [Marinomonas sp.]|jgi:LysR family transcriptional regulator, glycine cleavage system transcriptional activator|uniref:Transcriptional regulator n=1 Tax=Marinomonas pontica TaxID=264739 RepID=A0ABN6WH47_9GAMM|nr:LysR substrate-binding domain-containing protein [Marinomonas pontica]MCW8354896.1 LysR substrate-binding domain-containing protein [Marinomonas pontica]BDX01261.1 transcriptional regulator [Marinomonas pontica]